MAWSKTVEFRALVERLEKGPKRLAGSLASGATGRYAKGAALLSVVYLLALLPFIRANYSYEDDRGRVLMGYFG